MFDVINNVVGAISGVLYQPWCVPLILLLGGLILTIRSKFIQGRMFTEMFKVVTEKPKTEGGISSFGALMVSTASRVGTGNIIGVTSAIAVGGPGALFWLWIAAHYKVQYLSDVTSVYRVLLNSASHSDSKELQIQFILSSYEIQLYFAERYLPECSYDIENKKLFYDSLLLACRNKKIESIKLFLR